MKKIFILAGEPSGDLHAAELVKKIKLHLPDAQIAAIGGALLKSAGVNLISDLAKEAVTGFSELFFKLPIILKNFSIALSASKEADLVILVDYPGFNFRLAKSIAKLRSKPKVLYYIAPQVWAWHKSRAAQLSAITDKIAVVFPFEEKLFSNAVYVGHPLLDYPPPEPDTELIKENVAALLPGSRKNEIKRHLPILIKTGKELKKKGWRPVLSLCIPELINSVDTEGLEIYSGSARKLLVSSKRAIIKTGTSTLEAALYGIPFVAYYKVSLISYLIGKRLVETNRFAMPNIILKKDIVPELIQDNATPENIISEFIKIDDNFMKQYFAEIREVLGQDGSAENTAKLCLELLEK